MKEEWEETCGRKEEQEKTRDERRSKSDACWGR